MNHPRHRALFISVSMGACLTLAMAGVAFGAPALTAPIGDLTDGTSNPALSDKVCNQGDFAFAIDLSSSIGTEGNFAPEKAGAKGFADAFQTAGGDGIYAGTYFNGDSAHTFTDGFVAPDIFKSGVDGLPNPSDYTPTAAGITTAAGNTGQAIAAAFLMSFSSSPTARPIGRPAVGTSTTPRPGLPAPMPPSTRPTPLAARAGS